MKEKDPAHLCTLLVCSCDAYSDVWTPFFTILKAQWPDNPFPIVLNTESKSFSMPGLDIGTFSFYKVGQDVPWGKRMIRHLHKIKTDYILLLLDDYFLESPVDAALIMQWFDWIGDNKKIAAIYDKRAHKKLVSPSFHPSEKYLGYGELPPDQVYRIKLQASLWRRKDLLRFLRGHETPWETEILGSNRTRKTNKVFLEPANNNRAFNYNAELGGAIHRGRWVEDVAVPLAKKYGLEIDFSTRGFYTENAPPAVKETSAFQAGSSQHRVLTYQGKNPFLLLRRKASRFKMLATNKWRAFRSKY